MRRTAKSRVVDAEHREKLVVRIEQLTELPLLILAFATIPLLVGPFLWHLSPAETATFASLNSFIWAVYAVVFGIKIAIVPGKIAYLKRNWLEVLIVVAPFARPVRLISILVYGSRAFVGARRLANVDFLLVYGIGEQQNDTMLVA